MEKMALLLIIGSAIVVTLGAGKAVNRLHLPMVIGYVFIGVLLGKSFFNLFPSSLIFNLRFINDIALGIIAFMIGGELHFSRLRMLGKTIVSIALLESLGAFAIVGLATYLLTGKVYYGLILGAVASATAPAATVSVINQYKAKGPLTSTILGVVGSDDALALIIYAFASAISYPFITHHSISVFKAIFSPLREIGLSLSLGGILGLCLSYLLRRMKAKEETFALA